MEEAVSDVLAARTHDLDGMSRMVSVSFAAHVGILVALFVIPQLWPARHAPAAIIMTINLGGGTPGPKVPGITAAGARPVEEVVPTPKRPEPTPTATSKPPDTTAPIAMAPKAATAPTPKPAPVKPAPDPARYYTLNNAPTSNKPITGSQRQTGSAQAETGVKGVSPGLASGGMNGVTLDLDTAFCCNDYLHDVVARIQAHTPQNLTSRGTNIFKFTIEKDGRIDVNSISCDQKSGQADLDYLSDRALKLTGQVGPLPGAFAGPRLTIHLTFQYGGS